MERLIATLTGSLQSSLNKLLREPCPIYDGRPLLLLLAWQACGSGCFTKGGLDTGTGISDRKPLALLWATLQLLSAWHSIKGARPLDF